VFSGFTSEQKELKKLLGKRAKKVENVEQILGPKSVSKRPKYRS
jgi:hypothetical protein